MSNPSRKFIFDKIISKYQSLSEKAKLTVDICIKIAIVFFAIVFLYKSGSALGEYLFNINIKV
jgi:uncharacterized membrane protein